MTCKDDDTEINKTINVLVYNKMFIILKFN